MKGTRCALQSRDRSRPEEPDELHRLCPVDAIVRCAGVGGVMTEIRSLATTAYVWGSALVAATRLRQTVHAPRRSVRGSPCQLRCGATEQPRPPAETVGPAAGRRRPQRGHPLLAGLARHWTRHRSSSRPPTSVTATTPSRSATPTPNATSAPGCARTGRNCPRCSYTGRRTAVPCRTAMLPVASRTRYLMIAGRILVQPEDPDDVTVVRRLQEQITTAHAAPVGDRSRAAPTRSPRSVGCPAPPTSADPDLLFLHQLGCRPRRRRRHPCRARAGRLVLAARTATRRRVRPRRRSARRIGPRSSPASETAKRSSRRRSGISAAPANGWSVNLQGSRFGDDYLLRAAVAKNQIYVVPADEAVYPVTRVDGNGRPPGRTKPVPAGPRVPTAGRRLLVAHRLRDTRSAGRQPVEPLRDRRPDAWSRPGERRGPDDLPAARRTGRGRPSNWLPVPAGPFHLMMRLYWPQPAVLEGRWHPPPIERRRRPTIRRTDQP